MKEENDDEHEQGSSSAEAVVPLKKVKRETKNPSHVQLSDAIRIFFDQKLSDHADVYDGEQLHGDFSQPVVVKLVDKNERNKRMAKILSKLNHHSNVISLIASGFYDSGIEIYIYIAIDKCHTENLQEFVENQSEIPLDRKLEIVRQIITGIEYIHGKNIVHLDLKPANIFFTIDKKTVKISDFGLSEEISGKKIFVKYQFGTNGYRPPESFGNSYISLKTDIFSAGVVFYFIMSDGKNPFGDDLYGQNSNMKNGKIDLSCLLVPNRETTKHLIKNMIELKRHKRPTITEVSEHPCWTGNEVECDFGYKSPEDSDSDSFDDEEEQRPYNPNIILTLFTLLEKYKRQKDDSSVRPKLAAPKRKRGIMAQILMKDEEVMVLCFSKQCGEITRMIEYLKEDWFFKLLNPIPIPVCSDTEGSIQLQLIVYPPNERNIMINPPHHHVDIRGIQTGSPVAFSFICKSSKVEVKADIELRVRKGNDIKFKHPIQFIQHGSEQRGGSAAFMSGGTIGKLNISNANINITRNQQHREPSSPDN